MKKIKIGIIALLLMAGFIIKSNVVKNEYQIRENNDSENLRTNYDVTNAKYPDSMILEYDIDEDNYELKIPIQGINGSVTIHWGDGSDPTTHTDENISHLYNTKGKYIVEISDDFHKFSAISDVMNMKLIHVHRFNNSISNLSRAFFGAINLVSVAELPIGNNVTDMSYMFYNAYSFNQPLTFDTSEVTNMSNMFYTAYSFNQPLNFNTSNVTDMSYMFIFAHSFNQPLTFDTSKVTNMAAMFYNASAFNQPLTFETSEVTNMIYMFNSASSFDQPLKFNTSKVIDMGHMFSYARLFNGKLDFEDTSKVTNMSYMFRAARKFNQSLTFNTSNVINMEYMFANTELFNGELNFNDTSKVTNMSYMFYGSSSFNQPLTFNTSNVINMENMFGYTQLFNGELNFDDTSKVTDMKSMFADAKSFNQPLTFNTSNVTDMSYMFYFAGSFNKKIVFQDTSNVTSMKSMFYMAKSFNQPLTFNTSNVTDMSYMFIFAESFNGELNFEDTSKVTNMQAMFSGATSFNQPLTFNTSNVTDMRNMFDDAKSFNQPLNFNTSNVTNMRYMFAGAELFNGELIFNDTSKVTNMDSMFFEAKSFNQTLTFDTSNVTNMRFMFGFAELFNKKLDFKDTSKVTNMEGMFHATKKFNQPLNFNTSEVTDMSYMFHKTESFNQSLDFNTSNVINMEYMFANTELFNEELNFDDTSKVTDMSYMFYNAKAFNRSLTFNTSNVTDMSHMFQKAKAFNKSLTFNTSNVVDMKYMFANTELFNEELNFDDTSKVTDMSYMFADAKLFNQLLDFNTSNVFNMEYMFQNATKFNKQLNFNTSQVIAMEGMFDGASSFNQSLNFDFRNVRWINFMVSNSNLSTENYNKFIKKLKEDKEKTNSAKFGNSKTNLWKFKREFNNKINFEWLKNFGLEIDDSGYLEIDIKSSLNLINNSYYLSYEITGLEYADEENGILSLLSYNEIIEDEIHYAVVKINLTGNERYIINLNNEKFEILYYDLSDVRLNEKLFVYNRNPQGPTIAGLPAGLKIKIISGETQINAGEYTITFEYINENLNYLLPKLSDSLTYTISKANYDMTNVKLDNDILSYNGEIQSLTLSELPSEVNYQVISGNNNKDVGYHTLEVKYEYDEINYKLTNEKYKFEYKITRTFDLSNVILEESKFYYDGLEKEIKFLNFPEELKIIYTNNRQTNPGKYYLSYDFGNYDKNLYSYENEPENNIPFYIIKKIDLKDIKWSISEFNYDGKEHKVYLQEIPDEIVKYEGNIATQPGTYTASVTFIENNDKYELLNKDKIKDQIWKILKQESTNNNQKNEKDTNVFKNNIFGIIITFEIIILIIEMLLFLAFNKKRTKLLSLTIPFYFFYINETLGIIISLMLATLILIMAYIIYKIFLRRKKALYLKYDEDKIIIEKNEDPILIEDPNYVDDEIVEDWQDSSTYARYNYSFDAKAHLADIETKKRYNALKNYLLSFKDMKLKKSWRNESYTIKGKRIAKFWINGKIIDMYISINPKDMEESPSYKYVGNKEIHKKTPVLFKISNNLNLKKAYSLIDMVLKTREKDEFKTEENYILEYVERKKLLEQGLIRIKVYKKKDKKLE